MLNLDTHVLLHIAVGLDQPEMKRALRTLHVWPLDHEVCQRSCELDFSSEPADQLIAATSVVHGVPLLTRDRRIRRSRMVPLAR